MSGIQIDAEARVHDARRELAKLNDSLAGIFRNASFSDKALRGVFETKDAKRLSSTLNKTSRDFKRMGRTGQQAISKVNREGMQTQQIFRGIQRTVLSIGAGIAAWYSVGALNRASDELVGYSNKLQLVHSSSLDIYKVQNRLYQLSKDTRSVLDDNVKLYVDLAKASENSNRSTSESIDALETLQKMAAISGSPLESLRAAFVQLGQGISAGALRGEELNSVMEQMKPLSHALQKELGMTAGALREFAATGGITDAVIFRTLRNSAEETREVFERTVIRIDQATAQMATSATVLKGTFAEMTSYTQVVSKFFLNLRDTFEEMAGSLIFGFAALKLEYHNTLVSMRKDPELKRLLDEYGQIGVKIAFIGSKFGISNGMVKSIPGFESLLKVISRLFNAVTATDIGRIFENVGKVLGSVVDSAGVALAKFGGYFGNVSTTLTSFTKTIGAELLKGVSFLNAGVTSQFYEMADAIGSVNDSINPLATAKNVERAFTNIFRSKSFDEFIGNWGIFNDEMEEGRNWVVLRQLTTLGKNFDSLLNPVRDVLVGLDLMDNRLLFLRQTRLDLLIRDFNLLRDSIARTFNAIVLPSIYKYIWPAVYRLGVIALTIADAIGDTFMALDGEAAAKAVLSVVKTFVSTIKDGLTGISGAVELKTLAPDSGYLLGEFLYMFSRVFKGLTSFVFDFFITLGKEIGVALYNGLVFGMNYAATKIVTAGKQLKSAIDDFAADLFDALSVIGEGVFESSIQGINNFLEITQSVLRDSQRMLRSAVSVIASFTEKVKSLFFDAYDAVVGHSYWPDLVDGVIAHSKRLHETALGWVSGFTKSVQKAFSGLRFNTDTFQGLIASVAKVAEAIAELGVLAASNLLGSFVDALPDMAVELTDRLDEMSNSLAVLATRLLDPIGLLSDLGETFREMSSKLYSFAKSGFSSALRSVVDFGKKVKDVFLDMYDKIVGNSYWPDLMDGIVDETSKLDKVGEKIRDFAADTKNQFSLLTSNYGAMTFTPNLQVGDIVTAVAGVDWGRVSRVVMTNLFAAVSATFGLFAQSTILKLGSLGFFIGLFGEAFQVSIGSLSNILGEGLGRVAANFVNQLLDGIRVILNIIIDTVPEIIRGMSKSLFAGLGDSISGALASTIEFIFSNAVVNGLIAGVAAYGLLAGKGLAPLTDLLLGSMAGAGANRQRSGGILGLLFPGSANASGAIYNRFNKLGVLAVASFAAPFLFDSVSLFEGLMVGIPLAIASVLGPDGAKKAISSFIGFVVSAGMGAFTTLKTFAATVFPTIAAGLSSIFSSGGGSNVFSAFIGTLGTVKSSLGEVLNRVMIFRDYYASGDISLGEMLFGDGAGSDLLNAAEDAFDAFGNVVTSAVNNISEFGRAIRRAGVRALGFLTSTADLVKRFVLESVSNIASAARRVVAPIVQAGVFVFEFLAASAEVLKRVVTESISGMMSALRGMSGLQKTLLASVLVLAGALISSNSEASAFGNAIGDAGGELIKFVGLVSGLLATVVAIKKINTAIIATRALMNNGLNTGGLIKTFLGQLFTVPAELVGFGGRLKTAVASTAGVLASSVTGILEGLWTLTSGIARSVGFITLGLGKLVAGLAGFALNISGSGSLIYRSFGNLFEGLASIFTSGFSALWDIMSGSFSGLFTAFVDWISLLRAPFSLAMTAIFEAIELGWLAIRIMWLEYGEQLTALIKRWSLIGLGVAGAGVIGLYIFGPEGTFGQKIEYAIDKVKELFGLQPGGGLARFAKVVEGLGGLGQEEQVINIRAALSQVDLENTSSRDFSRLARLMKTTADELQNIEDAIFEAGGEITLSQQMELDKLSKTVLRASTRLPQTDLNPFEAAFKQTSSVFEDSSYSFGRAIDHFLASERRGDPKYTIEISQKELESQTERRKEKVNTLQRQRQGILRGPDSGPLEGMTSWFDDFRDDIVSFGKLKSIALGFEEPLENMTIALSHFFDKNAIAGESVEEITRSMRLFQQTTEQLAPYVDALSRQIDGGLSQDQAKRLTNPNRKLNQADENFLTEKIGAEAKDEFIALRDQMTGQFLKIMRQGGDAIGEAAKVVNFNTFDKLKETIKSQLDIVGAESDFSKQFLDFAVFEELEALGERIQEEAEKFEEEGGQTSALNAYNRAIQMAIQKRTADFITGLSTQNAFFNSQLTGIDSVVGIGMNALANFAINSNDEFRNVFKPLTESAREAKDNIENLLTGKASPKEISAAYDKMFNAQLSSINTININGSKALIDALRSSAGLSEIGDELFANIDTKMAIQIGKAAQELRAAQIAYEQSLVTGVKETQNVAIQRLKEAQNNAAAVDFKGQRGAASSVLDSSDFANTLAMAREAAALFGTEIPDGIAKVPAKLREWVGLQEKIAGLQAVMLRGDIGDAGIKTLQEWIGQYEQGLENLTKVATLADSLSFLPKEVREGSFNQLAKGVQDTLLALSATIEAERKKREDGMVIGNALSTSLETENRAIASASKLLAQTLYDTPRKIQDALGKYDITADMFGSIGKESLFKVLEMDANIQRLQGEMTKAFAKGERGKAFNLLGDVKDAEASAKEFADNLTRTLDDQLNDLQANLSVEMELSGLAGMDRAVSNLLTGAARALNEAFDELSKGSILPKDARQLESVRRNLEGIAAALITAESALQSIARKGTAGLKTMFDTVVNGGTSITKEMIAFAGKGRGEREGLFAQREALKAIEKIALSDNIPQQVAEIINNGVGKTDPVDLLKQIRTAAGDSLADLGTPLEQNTSEMKRLHDALKEATAAFRGESVSLPGNEWASDTPSKAEGNKTGDIQAGALATLRTRSQNIDLNALMGAGSSLKKQLKDITEQLGINISGIEELSGPQLDQLRTKLKGIVEIYKNADFTNAQSVQEFNEAVVSAVTNFEDLAVTLNKASQAGKSFADGIKSDIQQGFTDLLTGENKSFEDFGKMLLDKFTLGVIDAFAAGATEALFEGPMRAMFEGIGSETNETGGGLMSTLGALGKDAWTGLFGGEEESGSTAAGYTGDAFKSWASGGEEGTEAAAGFFSNVKGQFGELSASLEGGFFATLGSNFMGLLQSIGGWLQGLGGGGGGGDLFGTILGIGASVAGSWGGGGAAASSAAGASQAGYTGAAFGNWLKKADGGLITGPGTGTSDSIRAMLSNGEYVINAKATKANLPFLEAINSGQIEKFAKGGLVGGNALAAKPSQLSNRASNGSTNQVINLNITGDISRQTKAEIYKMLPSIAQGVNKQNREVGNRS